MKKIGKLEVDFQSFGLGVVLDWGKRTVYIVLGPLLFTFGREAW